MAPTARQHQAVEGEGALRCAESFGAYEKDGSSANFKANATFQMKDSTGETKTRVEKVYILERRLRHIKRWIPDHCLSPGSDLEVSQAFQSDVATLKPLDTHAKNVNLRFTIFLFFKKVSPLLHIFLHQ